MNFGRFSMHDIVVAIIGGIFVLIGNIIIDIRGYKKVSDKIGNVDNTTLSGQHKQIEEIITNKHEKINDTIKSVNENLSRDVNKSIEKVERISDKLIQKETENKYYYESLSDHQKELDGHIRGIEDLVREWKHVVSDNRRLKEENEVIRLKNNELLNENKRIKRKFSHQHNEQDLSL